jgi:hypothetical protein
VKGEEGEGEGEGEERAGGGREGNTVTTQIGKAGSRNFIPTSNCLRSGRYSIKGKVEGGQRIFFFLFGLFLKKVLLYGGEGREEGGAWRGRRKEEARKRREIHVLSMNAKKSFFFGHSSKNLFWSFRARSVATWKDHEIFFGVVSKIAFGLFSLLCLLPASIFSLLRLLLAFLLPPPSPFLPSTFLPLLIPPTHLCI